MADGEGSGGGQPLVEIVPNFSEGRRQDVMDAIVAALVVPGVRLLNRQADPDHNRLDASLAGSPEAVRRSALAGAAKAIDLIDMTGHHGSHPRMGAVDVIPFLPIRDMSMEDCVALARDVGREIAETLGVPVYLYDQAAQVPERRSLAEVRKGEYEGLKADVAEGRRLPDFGPHEIGRAGAVAVGARKPLIAFNVYLTGEDEAAAKEVARRVRESSGGLKNVRAIGFFLPERGCVTVSMNLVDHEATPIYRAFELVRTEAARFGMEVLSTEIVGLVPQSAVADTAEYYLRLEGFDAQAQVLELAMQRAETGSGDEGAPTERSVPAFLHVLASDAPTPGGGTAAAVAGAMGAALIGMVARLTVGRKGYEGLEARMGEIVSAAEEGRRALMDLAARDAAAFDAVMGAFRMPKDSDEAKAARSAAIQEATRGAAKAPLEVARQGTALMDLALEVTREGNATAASDGATAGHLLHACVEGAVANVEINLGSLKDQAVVAALGEEAQALRSRATERLAGVTEAFENRMSS